MSRAAIRHGRTGLVDALGLVGEGTPLAAWGAGDPEEPMQEFEWEPIPASKVEAWNQRLLATDASFYQYPFWNEPYRRVRCTPHYLVCGPPEAPAAYACVLSLGWTGIRLGLVHHGPVLLGKGAALPALAAGLLRWARQNRIAFLRFTHADAARLHEIESAGGAERIDSFPFHRGDPAWDLILSLPEDREALTASLRKDARREIRRDQCKGYEVRVESSPQALAAIWPMFDAHARRRRFRHNRPLSWWLEAMRHARPYGCARLYVASFEGKPAVADLYVRDRSRVRSITACDEEALQGNPVPSTFLIWHAMCDLQRMGIREYSFGPSYGGSYEYKLKFHPTKVVYPEPVTLIAREPAYRLWSATVLRVVASWPQVRRALIHRQAKSSEAGGT